MGEHSIDEINISPGLLAFIEALQPQLSQTRKQEHVFCFVGTARVLCYKTEERLQEFEELTLQRR